MPELPTIRLSAPRLLSLCIVLVVLALLIGKRLDMPFAGGSGAGAHADAVLEATFPVTSEPSTFSAPDRLKRGETVTTDGVAFVAYHVNDCTVYLAENSSLTLLDGRDGHTTFNLLTGRAVAQGTCAFTTRETRVNVEGATTLIHFSWLDTLVAKVIEGTAEVSQSGVITHLAPETLATHFSTLPSSITQTQEEISLTQNDLIASFYSWSLHN